jgi:hypothetical protein
MVTLAEAVELASVPESGVLVAVLTASACPLTVTANVVPSGTFEASMLTVTGFVVPAGNTISGFE